MVLELRKRTSTSESLFVLFFVLFFPVRFGRAFVSRFVNNIFIYVFQL